MNVVAQTNLLNQIIRDFDAAYRTFLKRKKLPDCPVVRAGFFQAAALVVRQDPIPCAAVQRDVLSYLKLAAALAEEESLDEVTHIFVEVAQARMNVY